MVCENEMAKFSFGSTLIVNRITRSLYILKFILFQQNTKIVKSNFCFLSKQHYQDVIQFISKYRYKTEMLN